MPLGKEVGLGPGQIVLDGDPVGTQPPTAAPPHFRAMPIVAKRSTISATAELLLIYSMVSVNRSIVSYNKYLVVVITVVVVFTARRSYAIVNICLLS